MGLLFAATSTALALNGGHAALNKPAGGITPGPGPQPSPAPPPSNQPPPSSQPPGKTQPPGSRAPSRPHSSEGSGPKALINQATISGDPSLEETEAIADGFSVTVVDASTWGSMSASQFAAYQLLIVGDPTCGTLNNSVTNNAS